MGGSALDRVFAIAEGQDGFFTTRQAAREDVSKEAILQAERRGRVERYHRGVYRLVNYPFNANTAHYWAAVLWSHSRSEIQATLSHETALKIHELSDANPEQVHITVPESVRIQRQAPPWLKVHRGKLLPNETELVDGLPVTTAVKTLEVLFDSPQRNIAMLSDAIRDAELRHILVPKELKAKVSVST